jgi:hypothetical protein
VTAIADASLPLVASREPGLYSDISLEDYHNDPTTLSSSGARKLLKPSCPAKFKHWRDNPEPPKLHFEIGTAAHTLLLGDGPELVECDYDSWRPKDAQAEKAAAEARGATALLKHQMDDVRAMVRTVRQHPIAGKLFTPGSGVAEQSLYWLHRGTGVTLRCRPDWLRADRIVDYKTCTRADLDQIQKDVANYGYHIQDAWYRAGVKALGLCDGEPKFTFVFQEKTAPYLITIVELDPPALDIGKRLMEMAIYAYAECTASDVWPDYMADDAPYIPQISLPAWVEREYR